MTLAFSEIIRSIEAEIQSGYLPDAIRWADQRFDGAWSKAIDEFDLALGKCMARADYVSARLAGQKYRETVLQLLTKFKTTKLVDDTQEFLKSISRGRS